MTPEPSVAPEPKPTPEPEPPPKQIGGPRPGAGRKPKKEREKLGQVAQVKLRIREKHALEARAEKAGLSVSGYIRKSLGFPPVE